MRQRWSGHRTQLKSNRRGPQSLRRRLPVGFLFVNVAGQRARQLRRGAAARLDVEVLTRLESSKAERLAMEEVRCGLVYYDLPEWSPRQVEEVIVDHRGDVALADSRREGMRSGVGVVRRSLNGRLLASSHCRPPGTCFEAVKPREDSPARQCLVAAF